MKEIKEKFNFMVVDMQKGFIKPSTKYLIEAINLIIDSRLFDEIVYTQFLGSEDSYLAKLLEWNELQDKTSRSFVVNIPSGSLIVKQQATYGITESDIREIKEMGITKLCISGLDIDACVKTIGTNLLDNGVHPVFITDLCDTSTSKPERGKAIKDAALLLIERNFGEKCMITTDELIDELINNIQKGKTNATEKEWMAIKNELISLMQKALTGKTDEEWVITKNELINNIQKATATQKLDVYIKEVQNKLTKLVLAYATPDEAEEVLEETLLKQSENVLALNNREASENFDFRVTIILEQWVKLDKVAIKHGQMMKIAEKKAIENQHNEINLRIKDTLKHNYPIDEQTEGM